MKEILKELTALQGPPGNERQISGYAEALLRKYCDEVKIDKLFNVIGIKRADKTKEAKYKVMVTAHADEIAMMAADIDENGFIKLLPVGGIDPRIMPAQEVIIHGRKEVFGVVGVKPPHLITPEEKKKEIDFKDLYIDVGMTRKAAEEMIQPGDYITFRHHWVELQNGLVSTKALDNRAGVAAIIGMLEELKDAVHDVDIVCVMSVQEEVGLRGAIVSSYEILPDAAVVIDACHGDMPGLDSEGTHKLGKGPAVGVGPNLHPQLTENMKQIAKDNNIPYQIDVEPGDTGTEAWAVQVSRKGVPTVLVSIPLRYMHTTVETINMDDLSNTSKLVSAFVRELGQRLEGLA